MIWFLTSITTFYFQKFINVIRTLNQAYTRETNRPRLREPSNSYVTFEDEPSAVSFRKDDVFDDTVDGARRRNKSFPVLQRKMSFAGGVDGTGQSIAILTSGGDSQG